jgi:RNA polymerase sigma-70 factor (sigma-E family)
MRETGAAEFEAFVVRSGRSLLRTAWALTGDYGHAEDIVQVALERTAQRWTRLSGEPEAYARRCVVNLATDRWRRRRARVSEVSLEASPAQPVDDGWEALALRDALLSALSSLPPRQRAVLVLRYLCDLDEAATADTLNVSVGTVKSSTSRALARLRENATELSPTWVSSSFEPGGTE